MRGQGLRWGQGARAGEKGPGTQPRESGEAPPSLQEVQKECNEGTFFGFSVAEWRLEDGRTTGAPSTEGSERHHRYLSVTAKNGSHPRRGHTSGLAVRIPHGSCVAFMPINQRRFHCSACWVWTQTQSQPGNLQALLPEVWSTHRQHRHPGWAC